MPDLVAQLPLEIDRFLGTTAPIAAVATFIATEPTRATSTEGAVTKERVGAGRVSLVAMFVVGSAFGAGSAMLAARDRIEAHTDGTSVVAHRRPWESAQEFRARHDRVSAWR
ncbi:MAG: hypothetical protein GY711_00385 [bacterium]|nr:hypothetical protein [bacterium]